MNIDYILKEKVSLKKLPISYYYSGSSLFEQQKAYSRIGKKPRKVHRLYSHTPTKYIEYIYLVGDIEGTFPFLGVTQLPKNIKHIDKQLFVALINSFILTTTLDLDVLFDIVESIGFEYVTVKEGYVLNKHISTDSVFRYCLHTRINNNIPHIIVNSIRTDNLVKEILLNHFTEWEHLYGYPKILKHFFYYIKSVL